MCGRYNIHDDPWLVELLCRLGIETRLATRANIAPTEHVPVIVEEDGRRELRSMRWWLVPSWAPAVDQRYSMFNAKAETLASSRAFRGPFLHRRCIVPASSFIEWTAADGRRQPWLIRPEHDAIAFAGLWDRWDKEAPALESCAIVTVAAAPGINRVHARMPAMLAPEDCARWLDVEHPLPDPSALLLPRLPGAFVLAPLSLAVNNSKHKNEALLAPVGEAWRVEPVDTR